MEFYCSLCLWYSRDCIGYLGAMPSVLRDAGKQRCNTRLFLQYHLSSEDWRHVQVGSSAGAAPL